MKARLHDPPFLRTLAWRRLTQLTSNAEEIKGGDDGVLGELAGWAVILLVWILVASQSELIKGPQKGR